MCNVVHMDSNIKTTLKLLVLLPKIRVEHTSPLNQNITVCDRIENSDRTGTGPDFVYKIPYRRAPRLACLGRVGRALIYISSIVKSVSYEEFRKSGKKLEKVGTSGKKSFI